MPHLNVIIPDPVRNVATASVAGIIAQIQSASPDRQMRIWMRLNTVGTPSKKDIANFADAAHWAYLILQLCIDKKTAVYVFDDVSRWHYRLTPAHLVSPPKAFFPLESFILGTFTVCEKMCSAGSLETRATNWTVRVPASLEKFLLKYSVSRAEVDRICSAIAAKAARDGQKLKKETLYRLAKEEEPNITSAQVLRWRKAKGGPTKLGRGRAAEGTAI